MADYVKYNMDDYVKYNCCMIF